MLQRALASLALLALLILPSASARAQTSAQPASQTAAASQTTATGSAPAAPGSAAAVSLTPPALPKFDLAEIHPSPYSAQPYMRGGDLRGDRVTIRQATMVNLVANAWSIENDRVLRGPSWLEIDRYDITAKAPRTTSKDDVKLMLRSLLAERFALVAHPDTKVLPAFLLTVGKNGSRMKEADGTGEPGCQYKPPPDNRPAGSPPPNIAFSCHGVTMADFAQDLRDWAGDYLTNPVVDQTNLKGAYDFDFKWTFKGNLAKAGADGISVFDAVDKQLGLKLEAKTAPLPVVFVDAVNEKPTPNAPGLDKLLPPPPPAEFEVAILKPSSPDTKGIMGRINGSEVSLQGGTLQWFITYAWDIRDEMIADPPKWLNQDRYDLLAKIPHDPANDGPKGAPQLDQDELQDMIKHLLAERFGLQTHMEDRPADGYSLVAVNPHLNKADPDNRTGCKEGPGPDGKDPRIANPILGRLLTCQNMTMAQFGDVLRIQAPGYIHSPVLDKTGLTGAYDFTLSFSTAGQLTSVPAPKNPNADPNAAAASDPTGGLSLFDAMQKQMGVKMEKEKHPVQMLVIDHVDEHPTDN